ncbi:MAG: hypothetical protein SFX72_17225 [Isosphaeraceae bacterium]|nr:hypothetical protein [Isosphaeraceae bacterium]
MMRSARVLALAIAFAAACTLQADAQGRGKPAPEELSGLPVGSKAPAFTLNDQSGKPRSLGDLSAKGKVALVFYRSADW